MALERVLIAESGGTKTDWVLLESGKVIATFKSESFHPRVIDESIKKKEFTEFINSLDVFNTSLYFFGAGCQDKSVADKISLLFEQLNFKSVHVKSDLYAAALALYQGKPGWFAIMGTGSVLCYFDGKEIKTIKGGLGYLLGDEGSGFYFGKLLIESYLRNELDSETNQLLKTILQDRSILMAQTYSKDGVSFVSSLAVKCQNIESDIIRIIHEQNIQLFRDKYLSSEIKDIGIIGSYAKGNETIIKSVFDPIIVSNCIERPIHLLTEYFLKATV